MQKKILLEISCFVWLIMVVTLNAQEAGKSGLAFLKIGVGSRAAALGEAYTALADEPAAIYWNPAGLSSASGTQLAFTHLSWLENINHDFIAVSFPGFGGKLGLAFTMQSIPDIELRDKPSAVPVSTLDARDLALALAYARPLNPRLDVGLSVKYLYEKIYLESASGFALDFGANWQTPIPNLRLGASLQNIGSMAALVNESITLPSLLRVGGAFGYPNRAGFTIATLALDHLTYFQGGSYSSAGVEISPLKEIALRAGFQFNRENRGMSAGFGTSLSRYQLDYGYAAFGEELGQTHRFSLGIRL
ncbi:MAG: PorV/PorQ family protein [bacterium]